MRISRDSDHDPCPVTDDLLGELYRANKNGLAELIATVSPDVRAALALYCYRRGHMKGIGLAIASTCDLYDLETAGGTAGAALYARSREATPAAPVASQYVARQKITLASGSLRKSLPIDEDVELGRGCGTRAVGIHANRVCAARVRVNVPAPLIRAQKRRPESQRITASTQRTPD